MPCPILNPFRKKGGDCPKSGDIAIGARTALDFNGNSHYVAIFEKNGRVPETSKAYAHKVRQMSGARFAFGAILP